MFLGGCRLFLKDYGIRLGFISQVRQQMAANMAMAQKRTLEAIIELSSSQSCCRIRSKRTRRSKRISRTSRRVKTRAKCDSAVLMNGLENKKKNQR